MTHNSSAKVDCPTVTATSFLLLFILPKEKEKTVRKREGAKEEVDLSN